MTLLSYIRPVHEVIASGLDPNVRTALTALSNLAVAIEYYNENHPHSVFISHQGNIDVSG